MHNPTTTAAAHDLAAIVRHWPHLRALVDTTTPAVWPPADTDRAGYLRTIEQHHSEQQPADREHPTLAETPAPVRLHIVDASRAIEAALCHLADEIAAEIQRSPLAPPRTAPVGDDVLDHLDTLAEQDAADSRRWRYTNAGGRGERTAVRAAEWLRARLHGEAGPFAPLDEAQRRRIARVARGARERIERTIGADRRTVTMPEDRPCPWCGGELRMACGGSDAPVVTCRNGWDCGAPVPVRDGCRRWAAPHELAALRRALDEAERRRRERDRKRRQRAEKRVA
ncbi:hypothetical protein [Streptomyces pini]|uniref:Uncharacterized protein n=1 Tax=Streptomyces pini TaxID=1520580 RepID=A0A1I4BZJ8_9ACTN|nr:hypothetical protein [Streptomyces pini]SFK74222.1 hypothetical protein SAMN05192584_108200 [Streptomyces pini]